MIRTPFCGRLERTERLCHGRFEDTFRSRRTSPKSHATKGWIHHLRANLRAAERCYRNSIREWEKAAGPEAEGLSGPLDNLAQSLTERRRFREAEKVLRRALGLRQELPRLAGVLNSLAVVREALGDGQSALELLHRALAILERLPAGREAAGVRMNLGDLYRRHKRYTEAEAHLRAGIAKWRSDFGELHWEYAEGLVCLAQLHLDRWDYEAAEPLLVQALTIFEQTLGPSHPKLAPALDLYSHVARKNGRKDEAASHRERAREVRESSVQTTFREHSVDLAELARGK